MFKQIEEDEKLDDVRFSRWHQLQVTRYLWRYLEPAPPSTQQEYQTLLGRIGRHEKVLADIWSEISGMPTNGPAGEYLDLIMGEQEDLKDLAAFVRAEMPRNRKRGAPPTKRARLRLVNELARVYLSGGGRVTVSWDEGETDLKGGFAAFLTHIWEILPSNAKPPKARTFARLAKEVDRALRAKK
jgi:hypothetical protein